MPFYPYSFHSQACLPVCILWSPRPEAVMQLFLNWLVEEHQKSEQFFGGDTQVPPILPLFSPSETRVLCLCIGSRAKWDSYCRKNDGHWKTVGDNAGLAFLSPYLIVSQVCQLPFSLFCLTCFSLLSAEKNLQSAFPRASWDLIGTRTRKGKDFVCLFLLFRAILGHVEVARLGVE